MDVINSHSLPFYAHEIQLLDFMLYYNSDEQYIHELKHWS